MLSIALDDNEGPREEQVGLSRVEEPPEEFVVVGFKPGVGCATFLSTRLNLVSIGGMGRISCGTAAFD